jgi:hypothetical protein
MNGALDSVAGFPAITFVMAFLGPVLAIIFIAIFWIFRHRLRLPAALPGTLLALTSIAPQVIIGAFGILTAFQQIATQRQSGVRAVAGSMAAVTSSFALAISLSIGGIVALIIFQVICDRSEEPIERTESAENKLAPRILFFFTTASALATMALLWFFERTLDLIMVICDTSRKFEAQERLGNIPIEEVAGVISRRLLVCELFSFALLALLVTAPFWLLAGEAPEWVHEKSLTLAIVIALCLIPFGIAYHHEILYMLSLTHLK